VGNLSYELSATRQEEKMSTILLNEDGKLVSAENPSQLMTWEELLNPKNKQMFYWFLDELLKSLKGLNWLVLRDSGLPLDAFVFTSEAIETSYRAAAAAFVERWETPRYLSSDRSSFRAIYNEELQKFIEKRRAGRVAVEVRIPKGEMKYGNYSYGITVVSPGGQQFSITCSGSPSRPKWTWKKVNVWERYMPDGNTKETTETDLILSVYSEQDTDLSWKYGGISRSVTVCVDLVDDLPDIDGNWRWLIYLPDNTWQVKGGSTFWMPDNPIHYKAQKLTK